MKDEVQCLLCGAEAQQSKPKDGVVALTCTECSHTWNVTIHHCHARGCAAPVKPEMLMCLKHWRSVPKNIQRRVWATYRPGQCDDMSPSSEWHVAADAAIKAVWDKEQARAR